MFFNVLIDLILILILVIGSYYGYTRGLFLMLARPMRFVICYAFALSLCRPVGACLIEPMIYTPINDYLREILYDKFAASAPDTNQGIPTVLKLLGALLGMGIDEEALTVDGNVEVILNSFTAPLVGALAIAIAFIVLMILARLLFGFVIEGINGIMHIGLLGWLNRFLGVAMSSILAALVAWCVAVSFDFIIRTDLIKEQFDLCGFDGGPIYNFLVEFSPIRLILSF